MPNQLPSNSLIMSPCSARRRRILVIQDEAGEQNDFRKILGGSISQGGGQDDGKVAGPQPPSYEIDVASRGEEGLQMVEQALAEAHPYAVAFIDVSAPTSWDAIETTGQLWKACPDLQVVICTAHCDRSWSEIQAQINPLDRLLFLRKPFDTMEVLQLAHALTEKWRVLQDFWGVIENLDEAVRQRTQELQASESAALGMRDDAMRNKQRVEMAYEELKREMEERRKLQDQFRKQASLLDKARDAIIVCDLEHRISYWNKSAARLYNWTAEEAMGRCVPELICKDITVYSRAFAELIKSGEWVGELQQTRKDGCQITVEARWTLVSDANDTPSSILAIYTDVSHQKQLEHQFLRAQRMESIGTLAGGIAHDLNNVLTPITMSIELLKRKIPDEKSQEILNTIASSTRRGADMVKQVLSFARGMEGRRVQVQVKHLINDIVKMCGDTFPKQIQTQALFDDGLWTLEGDPTQLHQVLLNLCVNARDAMPEGGRLVISAQNVTLDENYASVNLEVKTGPHVMIQVEDSGTGMPQEVIDKIFDPFFTTKEIGRGTGLGLSTSLSIVRSHGGFIRVQSEPRRGTRFRIYLPALAAAQTQPTFEEVSQPPKGRGETVLIVDDEEFVRQVTQKTLELYDYNVLQAGDGVEALNVYSQHKGKEQIAVILMDMMMPQLDGASTIAILQKINPAVRIIATSGVGDYAAKAAALGVTRFIQKPYNGDTLLKEIALAIQGRS
jgi:PAS domain S-box-containing protein